MAELPKKTLPKPTAQLLDQLKQGAFKDAVKDIETVEALLLKDPFSYFVNGFPCPQYAGLSPVPVTPNTDIDFFYYPGDFETEHTLVVADITGGGAVEKWRTSVVPVPGPMPLKITIPKKTAGGVNNVFDAGHRYLLAFYPTILQSIPVGCVTWLLVTVAASAFESLFFSAIQLTPPAATPSFRKIVENPKA